ncbi:MAG: hypothetical protein IIB04_07475 [Acidobacteria bacterium]|nr:hypothetical protein [Acidobacteriota bacterium]
MTDPARAAREFPRHAGHILKRGEDLGFISDDSPNTRQRIARLDSITARHVQTVSAYMTGIASLIEDGRLSSELLAQTNAAIFNQDRLWLEESGIPGRPWYRSMYSAPDEDSGYASWMLPSLRYAVEHQNEDVRNTVAAIYFGKLREGRANFLMLHERAQAEASR